MSGSFYKPKPRLAKVLTILGLSSLALTVLLLLASMTLAVLCGIYSNLILRDYALICFCIAPMFGMITGYLSKEWHRAEGREPDTWR